MRILYPQPKSRSRENRLVLEGKWMTKAKVLAEFEATKILDHLAPDWPLLLDDGAIIDHILTVINRPLRLSAATTRSLQECRLGPGENGGRARAVGSLSNR